MTKTTNYNLNQWDADDPVRRTDFNEDNAKIDAALAGLASAKAEQSELNTVRVLATRSRFTKLWELTLAASSTEVTIPLTSIDWSRWDKIHLDILATWGSSLRMYVNEVNPYASSFSVLYFRKTFLPRYTFHVGFCADRMVSGNYLSTWLTFENTFAELKKLIISGSSMPAGGKFILWGEE